MQYKVGQSVELNKDRLGRVAFVGTVEFAKGLWYGVEVYDSPGQHSGGVGGVQYFNCKQGQGIFCKDGAKVGQKIIRALENDEENSRWTQLSKQMNNEPAGDSAVSSMLTTPRGVSESKGFDDNIPRNQTKDVALGAFRQMIASGADGSGLTWMQQKPENFQKPSDVVRVAPGVKRRDARHSIFSKKAARGMARDALGMGDGNIDALSPSLVVDDSRFENVDRHAWRCPRDRSTDVSTLASYLQEEAKTDIDKSRACFRWVVEHIDYATDMETDMSSSSSNPHNVLKTRRGACRSFANLFAALCTEIGLVAFPIEGWCKGDAYQIGMQLKNTPYNHVWAAVKVDGKFLLMDPTWGSGNKIGQKWESEWNPHFFATPPKIFIWDHFPAKPEHQYLQNPLTLEQFLNQAYIKSHFWKCKLGLRSHYGVTIRAEDTAVSA